MRSLVLFALLALTALQASPQQLYRWLDQEGKVHYSQTPPPPEAAKNLQRRQYGGGGAAPSAGLPYATQVAMKNYPVTFYTSPDCSACSEGRTYLNKRGVPHKEVSVSDAKGIEELKQIAGKAIVPALVVGRDVQAGFNVELWKSALDTAGYPASAPALSAPAAAKPETARKSTAE